MPCRTQKKKKKELSHDHFSDYKSEKGINFYKFLSNFFFFSSLEPEKSAEKKFFFFPLSRYSHHSTEITNYQTLVLIV